MPTKEVDASVAASVTRLLGEVRAAVNELDSFVIEAHETTMTDAEPDGTPVLTRAEVNELSEHRRKLDQLRQLYGPET